MECEFPKQNATSTEIRSVLERAKTVAVVGISPKEDRPSHRIAKDLIARGYKVYGVNPGMKEFEGQPVYKSLLDVPADIDIVDIFRSPDAVPAIVDEAIQKKAKVIWMQLGIVHNEAADRARAAGMTVVMNKCISVELMGF